MASIVKTLLIGCAAVSHTLHKPQVDSFSLPTPEGLTPTATRPSLLPGAPSSSTHGAQTDSALPPVMPVGLSLDATVEPSVNCEAPKADPLKESTQLSFTRFDEKEKVPTEHIPGHSAKPRTERRFNSTRLAICDCENAHLDKREQVIGVVTQNALNLKLRGKTLVIHDLASGKLAQSYLQLKDLLNNNFKDIVWNIVDAANPPQTCGLYDFATDGHLTRSERPGCESRPSVSDNVGQAVTEFLDLVTALAQTHEARIRVNVYQSFAFLNRAIVERKALPAHLILGIDPGQAPGDTPWLGANGMYFTDGNQMVKFIFDPEKKTFKNTKAEGSDALEGEIVEVYRNAHKNHGSLSWDTMRDLARDMKFAGRPNFKKEPFSTIEAALFLARNVSRNARCITLDDNEIRVLPALGK